MERLVCDIFHQAALLYFYSLHLQTMYEATINQTYTLCSLASTTSVNSGQGEYTDALIRMNIFNYAYVHEGLTTSLRGGRLLL